MKQLNKEEIEKKFDKFNQHWLDSGSLCIDDFKDFIFTTIEKVIDDLVGEEEEYLGPEE